MELQYINRVTYEFFADLCRLKSCMSKVQETLKSGITDSESATEIDTHT